MIQPSKSYIFSALRINFLMFLLFSATSAQLQAKTTLFTNANGYTLNDSGELIQFNSFAIEDDVIVSITPSNNAKPSISSDIVIDLQGKTVLPGLIDAHGHILGLGANLLEVDLRNSKSEEEAVSRVLTYVSRSSSKSKNDDWVVGRGWNQVLWPSNAFPSKASIDGHIKDRPVVLSRVDGHAVWVNSKALALAGIDRNSISPSGGEIVKDAEGEPTGVLIDNAITILEAAIPAPSEEEFAQQLDAAQNHLVSLGITSAHDAGISQHVRNFYIKKAESEQLKVRIYAMLAATDSKLMQMLKEGHYSDTNDFLSIRSVKAYGDGALGSRGAALLKPYSDDPHNSGLLLTPAETLPMLFNNVIGANFQLNFHAIGDKANRLALHQFAKSFAIFPENKERHRIEHAQVVAVEDIPLFKEYGVIPSMQPTHATSDMNMAEDRLGKERLKGAYAWQTFLDQGSRIAFGSDFPVELANAFHGLHAAVTRQNALNQPDKGWIKSESVSRVQALKGFTLDAAYAAFQEQKLGTIALGKKADFIVIDKDYFKVSESEIRNIEVLQTFVNGINVFTKQKDVSAK